LSENCDLGLKLGIKENRIFLHVSLKIRPVTSIKESNIGVKEEQCCCKSSNKTADGLQS